ncbi:MAG: hydrolase [Chromatiales bacterium]|jgi:predicted amidohydrolase|nr:hydrolase [Chromatiales bacterium]
MTLQYSVVGIQNQSTMAICRDDYMKDLERLAKSIGFGVWNCSLDLPVRLVALSEGGIGGWALGGGDDHFRVYNEVVPEIDGPETRFLGDIARQMNTYIIAQMICKDPEFMENRIFNIAFIIDPQGKIIHKHYKTAFYQREPNVAPSDIWDHYLDKYGDDPVKLSEAIFPVAKTEIGNIGTLICAEGSYPEAARGLAMNGAEIIWRTQYPEPWMGNNMAQIQNQSHAIFNTCYVVSPNIGAISLPGDPDHLLSCGKSQIIDYRGTIISEYQGGGETLVSAIVNIDGLRDFRLRGKWQNLVKDIRNEEYKVIYDAMEAKGGVYPKNLCMDGPPFTEAHQEELVKHQINKMVDWGVYTASKDWEPYAVDPEVTERLDQAANRKRGE